MSVDIYVPGYADHPDTMNVANGNFRKLADLINLELPQDGSLMGEIYELAKVREQVIIILQGIETMPELDAGTPDREITANEASCPLAQALAVGFGARVIECGWPPGYIKQRLGQLLRLIELAIREGKELRYS